MNPLLTALISAGTLPGELAIRAAFEWDIKRREQMDPEIRRQFDKAFADMATDWVQIYRTVYRVAGVELGGAPGAKAAPVPAPKESA